uniref:Uncharacterized protein n=1 Tax=uncultured Desulfobacterium sp. TaxID=201089 RepID=E1YI20_9BACT|nr:unknown protein [uncultured Desulfobacterium sp.]
MSDHNKNYFKAKRQQKTGQISTPETSPVGILYNFSQTHIIS